MHPSPRTPLRHISMHKALQFGSRVTLDMWFKKREAQKESLSLLYGARETDILASRYARHTAYTAARDKNERSRRASGDTALRLYAGFDF